MNLQWIRLKLKPGEIPDSLYDAARESLKNDVLIRYFCKKYSLPPTNKDIQAYTVEDMLVEYVADAIEDERIPLGVGGKPVKKVQYHGEEITLTGSSVFDDLEREWVDQDPTEYQKAIAMAQDEYEDDVNLLDQILPE